MRTMKLAAVLFICASFLFINGCGQELEDLRIQNQRQQDRINSLQSELQAKILELEQLQRKLAAAEAAGGVDLKTLQEQIKTLQEDIAAKNALIDKMQAQLLAGGTTILPVDLSTQLADLAKANGNLMSYDAERGIVKFNSDLTFEPGSDKVATTAEAAIKSLCAIMNGEDGKNFDIIVAGHTDDIPIQKPDTLAKHPTNWHLSVHRAIAVENIMEKASIAPIRLSVRGFGEYRPVAENAAGKKGNEKNRRVEIYIVPKGT
jgi:chemotaxis protein MotB